jgi:hypothetical protein
VQFRVDEEAPIGTHVVLPPRVASPAAAKDVRGKEHHRRAGSSVAPVTVIVLLELLVLTWG